MKKLLGILLLSAFFIGCNDRDGDGNKDINVHIDLDSAGEKIGNTMDKIGDSTKAKMDRLEDKLDKKRDSNADH